MIYHSGVLMRVTRSPLRGQYRGYTDFPFTRQLVRDCTQPMLTTFAPRAKGAIAALTKLPDITLASSRLAGITRNARCRFE